MSAVTFPARMESDTRSRTLRSPNHAEMSLASRLASEAEDATFPIGCVGRSSRTVGARVSPVVMGCFLQSVEVGEQNDDLFGDRAPKNEGDGSRDDPGVPSAPSRGEEGEGDERQGGELK